jgi:peptidyl-prolyl cis-trans isomerase SurA
MLMKRKAVNILIVLCFFSIAVFPPAAVSQDVLLDKVVAVVNKEVITWSDLYDFMESQARDKLQGISSEEKKKIFKENESFVLDGLIDMKLQLQAAKQAGINASKDDINESIEGIKKKYSVDEKGLIESLKGQGMNFEEYKKKISEQIALSRIVLQQVKSKIIIPESEVEENFAASKDLLNDETYKIRQIFFNKQTGDSAKKSLEEKANSIYHQLKAGSDFAEMAKRYSEDASAQIGGDLGYVKKDDLMEKFASVISKMKAGEVSEPFWTDKGLHIIKLEEKTEKLNEVQLRESIKNKLFEKYFMQKYNSWIRNLRENAYIEVRI